MDVPFKEIVVGMHTTGQGWVYTWRARLTGCSIDVSESIKSMYTFSKNSPACMWPGNVTCMWPACDLHVTYIRTTLKVLPSAFPSLSSKPHSSSLHLHPYVCTVYVYAPLQCGCSCGEGGMQRTGLASHAPLAIYHLWGPGDLWPQCVHMIWLSVS